MAVLSNGESALPAITKPIILTSYLLQNFLKKLYHD